MQTGDISQICNDLCFANDNRSSEVVAWPSSLICLSSFIWVWPYKAGTIWHYTCHASSSICVYLCIANMHCLLLVNLSLFDPWCHRFIISWSCAPQEATLAVWMGAENIPPTGILIFRTLISFYFHRILDCDCETTAFTLMYIYSTRVFCVFTTGSRAGICFIWARHLTRWRSWFYYLIFLISQGVSYYHLILSYLTGS